MRIHLILVSIAVCLFSSIASAQTWTAEEQEIWRLEEQQWKMGAAKDASWIETMTHPRISVWQAEDPMPSGKASLVRWTRYADTNTTVLEQEIFPISVTITGDVAVAHYRYRTAFENYKKEREMVTGRYTDVFIKEGNRWLFITWTGGDDPQN